MQLPLNFRIQSAQGFFQFCRKYSSYFFRCLYSKLSRTKSSPRSLAALKLERSEKQMDEGREGGASEESLSLQFARGKNA